MNKSKTLNIGLLLCDDVDAVYREKYGNYAAMFQQSLDPSREKIKLTPFRCYENETLPVAQNFDGFLISGSKYGVYEDEKWIKNLMDFVRQCWLLEVKVVGICFGHQLIAQALGGQTEKAKVGWGFGIHSAKITERQKWMRDVESLPSDFYNLVVIHQDQVVKIPEHFRTIAENDFCPNSMMVADGKMLGIQGHPEFSKAFCKLRADFRRELIGEEIYRATRNSLKNNDTHSAIILGWIMNFFKVNSPKVNSPKG